MIAFLGAGRLAETLIRGALAAAALRRDEIFVTCRRPDRAAELRPLALAHRENASTMQPCTLTSSPVIGQRRRKR
jgi:pyrroline-5-carboxylate reductase